jgi:RNA recognition motif-containing protein
MVIMSSMTNRKLLFSNLSYRTNDNTLINYFSQFGSIEHLYLYKDDQEQSLRQGFVIYKEVHAIEHVMCKRPHTIDNRTIHLHRSIPDHCINTKNMSEYLGIHLYANETRDMFINYFQAYGNIVDCRVYHTSSMNSKATGYAFVRFHDYDSVGKIDNITRNVNHRTRTTIMFIVDLSCVIDWIRI